MELYQEAERAPLKKHWQDYFYNRRIPIWSWILPLFGWALTLLQPSEASLWLASLLSVGVIVCVQSSVHHAEVIALKVGEPYGTLILALSVTLIEVALIAALLLKNGEGEAAFLARDTIFSTIMITLNGLVGLCLVFGGARFHEQVFTLQGVNASLATLAVLSVVVLVLPNYTVTFHGPAYSPLQLSFIALVSLILYGILVLIQTVSHREYFMVKAGPLEKPLSPADLSLKVTLVSLVLLVLSLAAVVVQAKSLSPLITSFVAKIGAPQAIVGVIIASVVLLPESIAAIRAARANNLQTSLNLALGSALATIGLTIPAIAVISLLTGWTLPLGLDPRGSVLLGLSLIVSILSLGTGRTTVLQGAIHLVLFAIFLFTTVVP